MTDAAPLQPQEGDWRPNPGPQTRFLQLTCHEALYGGAAGGGKSEAALVDALRYVGKGFGRNYQALLLRREFPELERTLIARSWELYPRLGGRYSQKKKLWLFPGGETVEFGHAEHEKDIRKYQGAQYQYVYFDEETTFTEYMYLYMFSRVRSAHGVPCRVRGGTNPGSEGHEWVFARFAAWLDPKHPNRAEPGEIRWFIRDNDVDTEVPKGTPLARSRTFIPAKLRDTPQLDDEYRANLRQLDPVTRAQLEDGNWLIKPGKGLYYKRAWFTFVEPDAVPTDVQWVRFWDRAATEPQKGKGDPDWTVGVLLGRVRSSHPRLAGKYVIAHAERMRGSPGDVEATIKATAALDNPGPEKPVMVALSKDPGQAGKFEAAYYARELAKYNVRFFPETGDKITRQNPVSAQCAAGNLLIVKGEWNTPFVATLESFPEGGHDDDVDALAGAFNALQQFEAYEAPKTQAQSSIRGRFAGF